MAAHITIVDDDDRGERMVSDPDRYFADARQQAELEVRRQTRRLFHHLHFREARR